MKGKDIAEILGYADTKQALKKHVDDEDKEKFSSLCNIKGGVDSTPPCNDQPRLNGGFN